MSAAVREYTAVGANRHPAIADWHGELLAFGADKNIALWRPQDKNYRGIVDVLSGHEDGINAIKFLSTSGSTYLISGSADKTIKLWKQNEESSVSDKHLFTCIQTLQDHQGPINCLEVVHDAGIVVSGSTDATVKAWKLIEVEGQIPALELLQTITIKPRFFPLNLAITPLPGSSGLLLAVAGTQTVIQLYVSPVSDETVDFSLQASLTGHEGWIRSLSFTPENNSPDSDLLLSSASQDKYIRLWRIHLGKELPAAVSAGADPTFGAFLPGKSLSNKAHRFQVADIHYSATFEALLLGHDDWIYTSAWKAQDGGLRLLTASADNSLAIWEPDSSSGIWVCITRMGEISAQKGSTTATGSMGGFWTALWSPCGKTIVGLGRTGSWRLWNYDAEQRLWMQSVGVSGHTRSVTGISWAKDGEYLLSTSSDQTTRLHAQWKRDDLSTWHEMSRPQIHGYDLNCIDSIGSSQFVSGADEKLMRVFNEPKAVAILLDNLCGIKGQPVESMPDAANIPVLGLSNKAIDVSEDAKPEDSAAAVAATEAIQTDKPPLEDDLSRHTLWPETEKLYGHGYEISTLAVSHDGAVVATACKASSIDHAVIRLFETQEWHEVKPPLTAHSLTATRVRFSPDDRYLLSVGRDRQWALFRRSKESKTVYEPAASNPKGHTRMILDAAWFPNSRKAFATAGRDKQVKLWSLVEDGDNLQVVGQPSIPLECSVTAVDFLDRESNISYLAVGTELGEVMVFGIGADFTVVQKLTVDRRLGSQIVDPITQLAWRPKSEKETTLAVASEDGTLRLYSLQLSS